MGAEERNGLRKRRSRGGVTELGEEREEIEESGKEPEKRGMGRKVWVRLIGEYRWSDRI